MKKIILSLILTQGLIAASIHDALIDNDIAKVARLIKLGAGYLNL